MTAAGRAYEERAGWIVAVAILLASLEDEYVLNPQMGVTRHPGAGLIA